MAVDTASKRFSLIGLGSHVPQVLPIPDGAIEIQDRAELLRLYQGIALSDVIEIWTIQNRDASSWSTETGRYVAPGYYYPPGYLVGDEGLFMIQAPATSIWTVVSGYRNDSRRERFRIDLGRDGQQFLESS